MKKRKEISGPQIEEITRLYGDFADSEKVKIFPNEAFGFLRITVERPLQLRWDVNNLVSDRRITVHIPEAMAPASRVLYLWRFVAVAVALFGAGFLYLSEQVRPGQLDRFRLGHFALLVLTFSLFFAIFTVLASALAALAPPGPWRPVAASVVRMLLYPFPLVGLALLYRKVT